MAETSWRTRTSPVRLIFRARDVLTLFGGEEKHFPSESALLLHLLSVSSKLHDI